MASAGWPRGTVFSQLPSAVTSTVDQPLGSPSLLVVLVLQGFIITSFGGLRRILEDKQLTGTIPIELGAKMRTLFVPLDLPQQQSNNSTSYQCTLCYVYRESAVRWHLLVVLGS
jgi:hypothetical protein